MLACEVCTLAPSLPCVGISGPEVSTQGLACHPATQSQARWCRDSLLLCADTLPEVCADTGLYVSRVLPHSIPVLWRPASLHPRSTSVHVGSRKLPQRPAPAVCLSGPLPLGWAAGRCCVVAGSQRRRGLPWPPQSGCWGEPARSLPAQSSPRGSRRPGQEVQGWSSGHFRWLPPQASS